MSTRRKLLIVFAVVFLVVTVAAQSSAALRLMPPETYGGGRSHAAGLSVYEKAREVMSSWMARLPSGPSPGGGGH
ncbi:hypothetical protein KSP39_PZI023767 [Platanthera zijinensis]|uniref:Transmembrane protein n=1 Tax=Platanthera zijinensis TaxID=2320716 RepID=A0AAP0ASN9_9ASPA